MEAEKVARARRARRPRRSAVAAPPCCGGSARGSCAHRMPPCYAQEVPKAKQFDEDPSVKVHRIRITLTSRNVRNLEKGQRSNTCSSPA